MLADVEYPVEFSYWDAARQYQRADVDIKGFVDARVRSVIFGRGLRGAAFRGRQVRWLASGGGNPRERFHRPIAQWDKM